MRRDPRGGLPIVGRDRELAAVAAAVRHAAAGSGRLLLLVGEAGAGKSLLLHELAGFARRAGVAILAGAADPAGADRPLGALEACVAAAGEASAGAALAAALRREAREAPAPFGGVTDPGRDQAEAVLAAVERLAARRPLVVALDDAQWADEASLRALRPVVRRLADLPVLVALALRPSPVPAPLRDLPADAPAERRVDVSLGPLVPDAVADLAASVLGARPGPRLLAALDPAGGNPLRVLDALHLLRHQERLAVGADGSVDLASGDGTPTGSAPLLQLLDAEAVELLRVAAVLGPTFSAAELAAMLERPAASLLAPISRAVDVGVVEAAGDVLRFRHALDREALLAGLAPAVLQALHLDAAQVAARSGAPASRVAHHLVEGAAPGDPETLDWLQRAAEEAGRQDPATAVRLLDRAVAVAPAEDARLPELEVALARALLFAGRPSAAEAIATKRLDAGCPEDRAEQLRSVLSIALFAQGRFFDAVQHLEALGERPGGRTPRRLVDAAYGRLLSYDLAGAQARGEEALAAAHETRDEESTSLVCMALSYVAMVRGDGERAVEHGRQAVAAADRSPDRVAHRFQPLLFLAMAHDLLDRTDDAHEALKASEAVATRIGSGGWDAPLRHGVTAGVHFRAGRFDDALAEAEAGLRLAEEHDAHLASVLLESHIALVELHRARITRAREAIERGEAHVARHGSRLGVTTLYWAKALLHRATREEPEAFELLKAMFELTTAVGMIGRNHLLAPDLVALGHGQRDVAEAACAQAAELAALSPSPSTLAAAHRCRGLLHDDVDELVAAVLVQEGTGRPVEEALACEDAAFALARRGRVGDARPLADRALAAYDAAGAALDATRLRTVLRGTGVRVRRRVTRPATGWESLTDSERRVVELVAQGLSNPEIAERLYVSRRTVESHLYHVFAKLGVSSRVELAVLAVRRT